MGSGKARAFLFVGALLALTLVVTAASPELRWRASVLRLKLAGELPHVSGAELLEKLTKRADEPYLNFQTGLRGLVADDVRLQRFDAEDPCPALWSTPFGSTWGRLSDDLVLEVFLFEQNVKNVYQNEAVQVSPGDVVFDVGGHLGTFTQAALGAGAARVVVLEPEPVNAHCLQKTFAEEIAAQRVVMVDAAAWDHPGTLRFGKPPKENSGMGRVDETGELVVRAVTLDAIAAELDLDRVDFVKMDIEGAEPQALLGARAVLRRFKPKLALAAYHGDHEFEDVASVIHALRPDYQNLSDPDHHNFAYYR
ncbi:MAG: FkbM family methyltransferase [Myxococcota bacterium]